MRMLSWKTISPKVWRPFATIAVLVLLHWVQTGEFDRAETVGMAIAALQALIAYRSNPGAAVSDDENVADPWAEGHGPGQAGISPDVATASRSAVSPTFREHGGRLLIERSHDHWSFPA